MSTLLIYSTVTCPWCDKAKAWMQSEGIPYQEIDVTEDEDLKRELFELTNQKTVPVFVREGKYVVGFDPKRIQAELLAA